MKPLGTTPYSLISWMDPAGNLLGVRGAPLNGGGKRPDPVATLAALTRLRKGHPAGASATFGPSLRCAGPKGGDGEGSKPPDVPVEELSPYRSIVPRPEAPLSPIVRGLTRGSPRARREFGHLFRFTPGALTEQDIETLILAAHTGPRWGDRSIRVLRFAIRHLPTFGRVLPGTRRFGLIQDLARFFLASPERVPTRLLSNLLDAFVRTFKAEEARLVRGLFSERDSIADESVMRTWIGEIAAVVLTEEGVVTTPLLERLAARLARQPTKIDSGTIRLLVDSIAYRLERNSEGFQERFKEKFGQDPAISTLGAVVEKGPEERSLEALAALFDFWSSSSGELSRLASRSLVVLAFSKRPGLLEKITGRLWGELGGPRSASALGTIGSLLDHYLYRESWAMYETTDADLQAARRAVLLLREGYQKKGLLMCLEGLGGRVLAIARNNPSLLTEAEIDLFEQGLREDPSEPACAVALSPLAVLPAKVGNEVSSRTRRALIAATLEGRAHAAYSLIASLENIVEVLPGGPSHLPDEGLAEALRPVIGQRMDGSSRKITPAGTGDYAARPIWRACLRYYSENPTGESLLVQSLWGVLTGALRSGEAVVVADALTQFHGSFFDSEGVRERLAGELARAVEEARAAGETDRADGIAVVFGHLVMCDGRFPVADSALTQIIESLVEGRLTKAADRLVALATGSYTNEIRRRSVEGLAEAVRQNRNRSALAGLNRILEHGPHNLDPATASNVLEALIQEPGEIPVILRLLRRHPSLRGRAGAFFCQEVLERNNRQAAEGLVEMVRDHREDIYRDESLTGQVTDALLHAHREKTHPDLDLLVVLQAIAKDQPRIGSRILKAILDP